MHFGDGYDLISNRTEADVVSNHKSNFNKLSNLLDRELSRCSKVERALEIMFKMYFVKDALSHDTLGELNAANESMQTKREVFSIIAMQE